MEVYIVNITNYIKGDVDGKNKLVRRKIIKVEGK